MDYGFIRTFALISPGKQRSRQNVPDVYYVYADFKVDYVPDVQVFLKCLQSTSALSILQSTYNVGSRIVRLQLDAKLSSIFSLKRAGTRWNWEGHGTSSSKGREKLLCDPLRSITVRAASSTIVVSGQYTHPSPTPCRHCVCAPSLHCHLQDSQLVSGN